MGKCQLYAEHLDEIFVTALLDICSIPNRNKRRAHCRLRKSERY